MWRATGALLLAAALLPAAGPAQAVGLYGADLTARLTITGFLDASGAPIGRPPELVVEGEAGLFDRFATTSGNASAEVPYTAEVLAADPSALQVGEGLDQRAGASGMVAPPAPGGSEALSATDGLVFLDNRSPTETFRVGFALQYAWSLAAARDEAGSETAHASVTLLLESLSGGTLFAFLEEAIAGSQPGTRSDAGLFTGELVLAPLDFDELGLVADAAGSAAIVPEPSTLTLLAFPALAALVARARRARAPA
jgi:hypothetical protein